jgi:signal peptidase I
MYRSALGQRDEQCRKKESEAEVEAQSAPILISPSRRGTRPSQTRTMRLQAMRVLDRTQGRIPQPWRTIVDWLATIAIAIAFVLAFEAQVAKPYRIPSPSMEPTLHCAKPTRFCQGRFSDRVIANRLAYRFGDPKRGQIVVFRAPEGAERCGLSDGGSIFVKRIVGLPGELVSERNGAIYVNGDRLVESYVDPALRGNETARWPRVASGHYFVLGDNRIHSCDSRTWGTVPRSDLIGPVMLTYWPPNRGSFR